MQGREGEALIGAGNPIALALQLGGHVARDAVGNVYRIAGHAEARRGHGDAFERAGEVWIGDDVARPLHATVLPETDVAPGRVEAQQLLVRHPAHGRWVERHGVMHIGADHEAVAGIGDGRRIDVGEVHRAVVGQGRRIALRFPSEPID